MRTFGLFAGTYYWFPKITGRMMSERLGKIQFWLTFVAFNGTFLPMHWLGLLGMPRRVAEYDPQFTDWNRVASIASFLLVASIVLFGYNLIRSMVAGERASSNPWGGRTLEWMTPSPVPYYNFKHVPFVLAAPYDYGEPLPYVGLEAEG